MQRATPATERLQRDAFVPPPERGLGPAATLAILVHIALLLCLSWVVKWRDQPVIITAQAELWAKLPLQTEPEPVPPTPPVEPAPRPAPPPPPPPPAKAKVEPVKPAPKAEPAPPPKVINDKLAEADIAEQKKKAKKLADEQAQKLALEAEAARKQKEKEESDAAARKQKEKEEADAAARKQKEKDDAEAARKQKEREDAEAARKAKEREEAARKERERQLKETQETKERLARLANVPDPALTASETKETRARMTKLAESPEPASISAVGTTISSAYAALIEAAIRPNVAFDKTSTAGNPEVVIQVGLLPDGKINTATIIKSSGNLRWDTAALNGVLKTGTLPKDERDHIEPTLQIVLRPRPR